MVRRAAAIALGRFARRIVSADQGLDEEAIFVPVPIPALVADKAAAEAEDKAEMGEEEAEMERLMKLAEPEKLDESPSVAVKSKERKPRPGLPRRLEPSAAALKIVSFRFYLASLVLFVSILLCSSFFAPPCASLSLSFSSSLFLSLYPAVQVSSYPAIYHQSVYLCILISRARASDPCRRSPPPPPHLQVCDEIIPLFLSLSDDDQDSVRLLAVQNCADLSLLVSEEVREQTVTPKALQLATDNSWRVRWQVADKLCELCTVMGPEVTKNHMVSAYERLQSDSEPEVRSAAAFQITAVAKIVGRDIAVKNLLACMSNLTADGSEHVRAALATVIMGMGPVFGKELTIEHLLPMFLQLLRDHSSEVRLNIISKCVFAWGRGDVCLCDD